MLNFPSESNRRNTAFNQLSTTFRRIFNPILLNGRKSKDLDKNSSSHSSKSGKQLIEDYKPSKVYPVSSEHPIEISLNVPNNSPQEDEFKECQICLLPLPKNSKQLECGHSSCDNCLIKYLKTEISESRVSITCPECPTLLHPNRIQELLSDDPQCLAKYEEFIVRKVLVTDPDTRYCPSPDCNYAVIATNCSKCPVLKCGREKCGTYFCYNCQKKCSENHKCKKFSTEANASSRNKTKSTRKLNKKSKRSKNDKTDSSIKIDELPSDDITVTSSDSEDSPTNLSTSEFMSKFNMKACPVCNIFIIKIDDGSCNHMTCSICGCQFCWLCIKKTSELHYLSPTGCTFFGKRQWSRKKQIFWQLGMLLGAPVFIALSAAIAIPSIIIGLPVWFGRKLQNKLSTKKLGKFKKYLFVSTGIVGSVIISPVLAAGAIAIGVPFLLAYVYGIVPITLCRSKAQMNDSKDPPMKISDEEAQAFLQQLSQKDMMKEKTQLNKTTIKKASKKSSKDKETVVKSKEDKYKLLTTRTALHNSIESIQSTKATKGSLNEFFEFELSFLVTDYSASDEASSSKDYSSVSNLELECKKKIKNDDLKTVQCEVHCDRFGKSLKKSNKKLEVKSLENLADMNFCEICNTSHIKKIIVHRPCCRNF